MSATGAASFLGHRPDLDGSGSVAERPTGPRRHRARSRRKVNHGRATKASGGKTTRNVAFPPKPRRGAGVEAASAEAGAGPGRGRSAGEATAGQRLPRLGGGEPRVGPAQGGCRLRLVVGQRRTPSRGALGRLLGPAGPFDVDLAGQLGHVGQHVTRLSRTSTNPPWTAATSSPEEVLIRTRPSPGRPGTGRGRPGRRSRRRRRCGTRPSRPRPSRGCAPGDTSSTCMARRPPPPSCRPSSPPASLPSTASWPSPAPSRRRPRCKRPAQARRRARR